MCDNCGNAFEWQDGTQMEDTERIYCDDCLSDLDYDECEHGYFESGCDDCAEESDGEPNE